MRPAAEVGEVALGIERDRSFGLPRELDLVRLALALEPCDRVLARELLPRPGAALGDLATHLFLDRLEVGLGDRLRELEVVVEAVRDRRPDRDLHAGMEAKHGLRQQMSCRMAQNRERVGVGRIARRQDLDALAVGKREPQVACLAVDAEEHGLLRQLRADRARGVEAGRAIGKFELRVVWEQDLHRGGG